MSSAATLSFELWLMKITGTKDRGASVHRYDRRYSKMITIARAELCDAEIF
jgi:hypothetical protein